MRRLAALPRLIGAGVLSVLLLASLVVIVTRLVGSSGDSLASEREAVMAQSSKFVTTLNTFGPEDLDDDGKTMPDYRSNIEKVASAKMRSEFLENGAPLAEATVAQQGAGRKADVYATGVGAIDDDTATVLVTGQIEFSFPKSEKSEERVVADRQLFRYTVDLVKDDEDWLVDDWAPAEQVPSGSEMPGGAQ